MAWKQRGGLKGSANEKAEEGGACVVSLDKARFELFSPSVNLFRHSKFLDPIFVRICYSFDLTGHFGCQGE